jgi:hypothetical protein
MKSKKFWAKTASAALFLAITRSPLAHEYANCRDTSDQSCWSITNSSADPVTLVCKHEGVGSEFKAISVEPGRSWSFQYCPGLSDGLGFSGGKVNCRLDKKNASVPFRFEANEFGERVAFSVSDSEAVASISSYWTKGRVKKHSIPLGKQK